MLLIFAVNEHFDFALFGPDHHRLIAHAAHHVKRIHRSATKGELKRIFLNALCKGTFQIMLDFEKPVSRT